ncbi:hypothetical protein ACJ41O_013570 [Fusarium nematophilum]
MGTEEKQAAADRAVRHAGRTFPVENRAAFLIPARHVVLTGLPVVDLRASRPGPDPTPRYFTFGMVAGVEERPSFFLWLALESRRGCESFPDAFVEFSGADNSLLLEKFCLVGAKHGTLISQTLDLESGIPVTVACRTLETA